jgi:secernin
MDKRIMNSRSCTSMLAKASATKTGDTIFAKNSDRPLNEAQPLCFYKAMDHPEGAEVQCSFIRVPQVRHTYACIGSRPYVFFGFEHGINEHGLMIGNEQVSGREIPERKWGLIGMDLLRLALERAKTAREAIDVISGLLEHIGTGGDPATRITAFNSNFIIADPNEAYLFESHQRAWVAKKIDDVGYLSNCYSIQDDYSLIGKDVIEEAVKKGWHHPGQKFNPAKAWTADDCIFAESEGFVRYARLDKLMRNREPLTPRLMMQNLRDHYDDEFLSNIMYSPAAAKIPCICSHPGGVSGCATAASAVTVIRKDAPKELRFTYWGSMAPPCCSIFRPFYNINWLPEDLQRADALFDADTQWWTFTELERYVALNYEKFAPGVKAKFRKLEEEFLDEAEYVESSFNGDAGILKEFSARAAKLSVDLARELTAEIKGKIKTSDIDRMLLAYFTESSAGCGMEYDKDIVK